MISRRHIAKTFKVAGLLLAGVAAAGFIAMYTSGAKPLSVQSGSMAPAINKGDLVSVKSVPFDELREGDVITFVSPEANATITHRVVALLPEDTAGNNVVTKGDANAIEDSPIEARSVVGRVEHSVPYLGYGLNFLRTWPGLILLIYIPALMIMIHETRRLAAHYRGMHYVLSQWLATRRGIRTSHAGRNVAILLVAGMTSLAIAMPVRAALIDAARLTGNTISVADKPEKPPKHKPHKRPHMPVKSYKHKWSSRAKDYCKERQSMDRNTSYSNHYTYENNDKSEQKYENSRQMKSDSPCKTQQR